MTSSVNLIITRRGTTGGRGSSAACANACTCQQRTSLHDCRGQTFVWSKAGSMICFQMACRAVWSSFESWGDRCRLSSLNMLSVRCLASGVSGTTSVAGLETASSPGKVAESEVGENRWLLTTCCVSANGGLGSGAKKVVTKTYSEVPLSIKTSSADRRRASTSSFC
jgi:hypothetical protein